MLINIRTLPEGHSELTQTIVNSEDKPQWPTLCGGLVCSGVIEKTAHEIHVTLSYKGRIAQECARCLERFELAISGTCSVLAAEASLKKKSTGCDEYADFYFDKEQEELDLSPAIFDEIMTSLPMKPLCTEDCAGIVVPETAREGKKVDPRWEALKKIRQQVNGER